MTINEFCIGQVSGVQPGVRFAAFDHIWQQSKNEKKCCHSSDNDSVYVDGFHNCLRFGNNWYRLPTYMYRLSSITAYRTYLLCYYGIPSMISDGSLIISKDKFTCSRVDLFVLDFG